MHGSLCSYKTCSWFFMIFFSLRYLCIFQSLPTYGVHYYEVKVKKYRKLIFLLFDGTRSVLCRSHDYLLSPPVMITIWFLLTSPHMIKHTVQVMRREEMITKDIMSWWLNKFSQLIPWEIYREHLGGFGCWYSWFLPLLQQIPPDQILRLTVLNCNFTCTWMVNKVVISL